MKTLIIITLLLLVLTIVLIVLIAKKFLDKTDYILASNTIIGSNITDNANKILNLLDTIERLQQDNYKKTINYISEEHKSIRTALTDTISVIGDANKNIMDLIDVSNKALINSINAIEEKLLTVPDSEDIIDSDELINRIAKRLYDEMIVAQGKVTEDYNKMVNLQAENSLSNKKTKKPSPAKNKHRTRAKKAENSYNSIHDPLQEKVNEEQLNQ